MLQQEHYIEEITDKLAWINSKIDLSSSLNLYDIAIHSETFFCDLLNIIFGYNLHNVNFSTKNYPAIDLADEKAAVAVQVTCENKRQKIQDTLTKFADHNYCKQYSRLIILIIGKNKPNFRDAFEISPDVLSFSKETDILDVKDLLGSIAALPFEKIREVHTFLQEHLAPNNGFSGTNNTDIVQTVTTIQQQVYALCVSKLNAIGVSTEIALNLISQDIESNKYNYILDAVSQGKQFLIGEFGSGKSHAIYVLIQSMAEQYLSGKINKIPLFARSKDILVAGSIQNWIKNLEIHHHSYFLFIDSLDEIPYSDAKKLVDETYYLSVLDSNNHILLCSRPLSILSDANKQIKILPFSFEDKVNIFEKIVKSSDGKSAFLHLNPQMDQMVSKPFFCILYSQFKADPHSWAKTEMDLVRAFVQKTLYPFQDTDHLYKDLSLIAVKVIERNLSEVHISEIHLSTNWNDVLKTGFISQENGYMSFILPVIAQWLAAEAIRQKIILIDDILTDSDRIERWLYPLSILFSQMTFDESEDYFSKIIHTAPAVASRIIRDGICFGSAQSLPTAYECGQKLHRCMQIWIESLGPLSEYIAPVKNYKQYPIAVSVTEHSLTYAWVKLDNTKDVLLMSRDQMLQHPIHSAIHMRPIPAQATWPWIITFEYLSDELNRVIKSHRIIPDGSQLEREYIWNTAKHLMSRGGLSEKPIALVDLNDYRKYIGRNLNINGYSFFPEYFFQKVDKLLANDTKHVTPPYPTSDKQSPGGWVWSNYSTEQFLNKVRYIYSSALNEYLNLVELIFPSVKEYLMIWKLSPCKIVGGLVFREDSIHFKDAPMLTWYIEALPLPEKNCVDIELKKIPFNDIELFKNLSSNNSNMRHLLECTPATSFSSEFLDICNSTPVTNLVYEWLKNDLTRIGWLSI